MEWQEEYNLTQTRAYEGEVPLEVIGDKTKRFPGLYCVTPLQEVNEFCISYAAYGNEAGTDHRYGNIALIVDLPQFDKRRSMGITTA